MTPMNSATAGDLSSRRHATAIFRLSDGRLRSEARLRCRYKVISDLFFEVSLYGSCDTDGDAEADSLSDYGMTTSLGYTF